jgi:hypothetical protein
LPRWPRRATLRGDSKTWKRFFLRSPSAKLQKLAYFTACLRALSNDFRATTVRKWWRELLQAGSSILTDRFRLHLYGRSLTVTAPHRAARVSERWRIGTEPSGQNGGRMRKNGIKPLPLGGGSVSPCKYTRAFLSRARQQAVYGVLPHPAREVAQA